MRWHVQRVGRIGTYLRITLRREQRFSGEGGHVVGMDENARAPGCVGSCWNSLSRMAPAFSLPA